MNRPPLRVVMEACGTAHHWARLFQTQGHVVRLGVQAQHRVREKLKSQRTSLLNLVRGVLREFGIVVPMGATKVKPAVRDALEDGDNALPMALRETLHGLLQQLDALESMMLWIEARLSSFAKQDAASRRHRQAPGVGVLTATALAASAGDLSRFSSGRHFAAWLGLTPKEYSSGKARRLGAITKRGDPYLRTLPIQGARSSVQRAMAVSAERATPEQVWIRDLSRRLMFGKLLVAIANKHARQLWAMLARDEDYDAQAWLRHPMVQRSARRATSAATE